MAGLLFEFVLIVLSGVAGVAAGFWVRSGQVADREDGREKEHEEETHRAREALARLQELASNVATEVGEHSTRVQEINDELTTNEVGEAEGVVEAVAKLINANKRMQQRLETAEERLEEQAVELESRIAEAMTDALTKLSNRRAFDQELSRRQSEFQRDGRPVGIVLLDVDHFKVFNDTHGHRAGDEVLRGVGRVLKRTVREMDIPCRYGGEEFAIVLPGTKVADAIIVADRARQAIETETFYFNDSELHVTVSAGAAELLPGESVEAAVQRTDEGLYASKEGGRNCCHWHDGKTCHLYQPKPDRSFSAGGNQSERAPGETAFWQVPSGDELSGVSTFASFHEAVQRRLAEQKRGGTQFSVMLVEIDDYPKIVARFGEQGGDLAFRALESFLKAAMREMDQVARYSSQVFSLLLPGATLEDAAGISERLRQAITKFSVPLSAGRLQFTASIGIAESIDTADVKQLLDRAERALEAAETSGLNRAGTQTATGTEATDEQVVPKVS